VEGSTLGHQCFGFGHDLLAQRQKTSGSEAQGLPISSLNRMPCFRTRNLALRVSDIEWTTAHAIRPSLSDMNKF
jgi:hypothetical protein